MKPEDAWKGEGRDKRKCKEYSKQEVEDAKHFLVKCARWQDEREKLIKRVKGKLLMILHGWHVQGKRSGDGGQRDVEEEIRVMVNNSL